MNELLGRTLATAAVALVLFFQSRRVTAGSQRRQAFELAAAAFAIFAMANGLVLRGIGDEMAIIGGTFIGLVLLAFSLFMLFQAYRSGEMSAEYQRARALLAEQRRQAAESRKAEEEQR